jgi:hypothetical protein
MAPKIKIPSEEDLAKLEAAAAATVPAEPAVEPAVVAEEAAPVVGLEPFVPNAEPPPEPEAPPAPAPVVLDLDVFVDGIDNARTEAEIADFVKANSEGLDNLNRARPDIIKQLEARITTNVERVRALSKIPVLGSGVRIPKVTLAECYPMLNGQRTHCPKGCLVQWSQDQIDDAVRQGVLLGDP